MSKIKYSIIGFTFIAATALTCFVQLNKFEFVENVLCDNWLMWIEMLENEERSNCNAGLTFDVNKRSTKPGHQNLTPLEWALAFNKMVAYKKLLRMGASPNLEPILCAPSSNTKYTSFLIQCIHKDLVMRNNLYYSSLLLEFGFDTREILLNKTKETELFDIFIDANHIHNSSGMPDNIKTSAISLEKLLKCYGVHIDSENIINTVHNVGTRK